MNKQIDPFSFDREHPLSVAMRSISRHWFLSYSKLMSLRWEWNESVAYGATDGRTLYLSQSGLDKLCRQPNASGLIAFLLVHEALHALLGHGWRISPLPNKDLANVAADYIINAMIAMRNRELKRDVFPLIEGVLLDEQLSGDKSLEQLYRELHKPQPNPQPQPQDEPQDQPDTDQDGDDTPDQQDSADSADDNEPTDSDDGESTEDGSGGDDGGDDTADSSADPSASSDSDGASSDLSDFVGTGAEDNLAPQLEEGESLDSAVNEIETANERIILSSEIDSRTNSDTGKTGSRIAKDKHKASALSWPDMLREWLTKRSRNGWDSPFNPAVHSASGLICAGRRTKQAGDIVLVIDTSGSVSQRTYERFLNEAQCVLDEVKPERLHLLSVSHVVADSVTIESGGYVPNKLIGGGGTRFQPAFDWIKLNVDDPDVVVYLTDGWSADLHLLDEPDYPLLWLCTSRDEKDFKTGEVIPINDF